MEPKSQYVVLAVAMAFVAGVASAQHTDEFTRSIGYAEYLKGADIRASRLVGERIRNAEGDTLGEIEEILIPRAQQDEMLVIVSAGGVLDVGDKLVALPYDDLRVSPDGDTFYIDRTEAQLREAPVFTYEAHAEQQRTHHAPNATARTAADRTRTAAPSAAAVPKSNVALDVFDHRASDIIGATVLDDRGESVGKVDDIVVSIDDSKLHAVFAIGGFVGFGAKLITLPFEGLQITSRDDEPQVRIPMTREQLDQLIASRPEFRYQRQVAQSPANTPRG